MELEEAKSYLETVIKVNNSVIKQARKNGDINTIELTADLDTQSIAIETLLQYIDQLEQENKTLKHTNKTYKGMLNKQNKMIDEMAEQLAGWAMFDSELQKSIMLYTQEQVKQYFEKKVEGK